MSIVSSPGTIGCAPKYFTHCSLYSVPSHLIVIEQIIEQTDSKVSRRKDIKIRVKISEIQNKETIGKNLQN